MKREPGFYWIRSKERWSVGRFHGEDGWTIIGNDGYGFEDSDFEEIDERRIERPSAAEAVEKLGDALRRQGFQ